jgi:hypothetical protein
MALPRSHNISCPELADRSGVDSTGGDESVALEVGKPGGGERVDFVVERAMA